MEQKNLLTILAERMATDPALMERAARVTTAEELHAFAQSEGAAINMETAQRLLPRLLSLCADEGKLSDDALDEVAGGKPSSCHNADFSDGAVGCTGGGSSC